MATEFHRTHRAFREDTRAALAVPLGVIAVIGCALVAWSARSSVNLWQSSPKGRLEAVAAPHSVEAPVLGRVSATHCALGSNIAVGDILLELDTESFRAERILTRTKLDSLARQLPIVETEQHAYDRAARAGTQVVTSSEELTALREDNARVMSSYADEEWKRSRRLQEGGLLGSLDMLKVVADTERKHAELQALKVGAWRDVWSLRREVQRDRAAVERLRRELASLQGEQLAMQEELTRLDLEIELRTIRAPVAGRIAKLNTLHKGAVIAHGAQIAVIVPPGPLHVVAEFPAGAVGLIKHGQLAEVRFASFPWMEFGSLQAHVERVGSEPGIEGVRVELAITPEQFHHIPLQHGLVGTVAIRVDEVTPLQFLLRSLGGSIKHGTDSATPQP